MTAYNAPLTQGRSARSATFRRSGRIAVALALLAAAIADLLQQATVRQVEARLAASWFGVLLTGPVTSFRDTVVFPWSGGPAIGLKITSECTVALLIGPLFIVAAALLVFARPRPHRLALGVAVSIAIMAAVNQVRLLIIAVAVQRWGLSGYEASHKFVGTLISLAGFVVGALALVRISTETSARGAADQERATT